MPNSPRRGRARNLGPPPGRLWKSRGPSDDTGHPGKAAAKPVYGRALSRRKTSAEAGRNAGSSPSWEAEYERLAGTLAVGHYSPATGKTYTYWVRQFQGFVKSRPAEGVSSQTAAAFLTDLARRKRVGASTQNQAFNALLFFFRKVLGKLFKPEGVTRAKQRRYIPQVLSRREIDDVMPPPYALEHFQKSSFRNCNILNRCTVSRCQYSLRI